MENIVLFGGGNQVQYVIDIIEKEGKYRIIGIIDSVKEIGISVFGYKIIGRLDNLHELMQFNNFNAGFISIGDNYTRYFLYNEIVKLKPDFKFINAIHPSSIIGNNVKFGIGVLAMAKCIFNPGSLIGDFTFFATAAQIEHDCIISDYASVSAGTILGGHVLIGKFSALTLGVVVLDRVSIGENTVVGAGSLVLKSLPDNVLVYGTPSVIIRGRKIGEKFLK
jgi:sugar O-acyltransferase (sialic acid O-acetyltransferase NeuD family)